jgi:hypothetical protein
VTLNDSAEPPMVPNRDDAKPPPRETILLQDLAPRRDVKGGAGKLLFGEQLLEERAAPKAPTDDVQESDEPQDL